MGTWAVRHRLGCHTKYCPFRFLAVTDNARDQGTYITELNTEDLRSWTLRPKHHLSGADEFEGLALDSGNYVMSTDLGALWVASIDDKYEKSVSSFGMRPGLSVCPNSGFEALTISNQYLFVGTWASNASNFRSGHVRADSSG